MQELLDSQRQYQNILKQVLNEHRCQVEALHQILEIKSFTCLNCNYATPNSTASFTGSSSVNSSVTETRPSIKEDTNVSSPHMTVANIKIDSNLKKWLQDLNIDANSIRRILVEEYTLEDILFYISREDLQRFRLK